MATVTTCDVCADLEGPAGPQSRATWEASVQVKRGSIVETTYRVDACDEHVGRACQLTVEEADTTADFMQVAVRRL